MFPRLRIPYRRAGGLVASLLLAPLLLALALVLSCNDPQSPAPTSNNDPGTLKGAYDGSSQALEFRVEVPGGGTAALRLVASDLSFDPATQLLHVQVAIRNTGTAAVQGPSSILLGEFDPAAVHPTNTPELACPACIPCPCFPWVYDYSGKYGDDGVLSPNETSAPVEWILVDPQGESFSFSARLGVDTTPAPGTISGYVFVDVDGDGHHRSIEPGIAGAGVTLLHGDTATGATTDDRGYFAFVVSEAGLYVVQRDSAGSCDPTTPSRRQVLVVQRPDGSLSGYAGADFGCRGEAPPDSTQIVVVGRVFEDLDRNGQPLPGEPGVAGVLITASSPRCPTFAPIQVRTDARGVYRLVLPRCEPPYYVQHEPLDGFVDTSPNPLVFPGPAGDGDPSNPPTPRPFLRADFGVARASSSGATIVGFVFRDTNRNGVADSDEPGIANVMVSASGLVCLTPVTAITHTDATGHYQLDASDIHCPPPWRVQREPLSGACDTSPNPLILGPGANGEPALPVFHADFGAAACDSMPPPTQRPVEGVVFLDLDRNGSRDAGEPGVPGATLQLLSFCDNIVQTQTDARGHYRFAAGVACTPTQVHLASPDFPLYTTPNPVPVPPGPPGANAVNVDFGVSGVAPR